VRWLCALPAGPGLRAELAPAGLSRGGRSSRRRPSPTTSWAASSCPSWTRATCGCAPSRRSRSRPPNRPRSPSDVRRIMASFPEVRYVVSQIGRPDDGTDVNGWDITEYSVGLKPRDQWTTAHNRDGLDEAMARKIWGDSRHRHPVQPVHRGQRRRGGLGREERAGHQAVRRRPGQAAAVRQQDCRHRQAPCPAPRMSGTDLLLGQPQIQITVDRAAIARYGLAVPTSRPSSPPPSAARPPPRCSRASAPSTSW
jgi:hypothetical protein